MALTENPLPYVIIFAILVLILLIVLTWVIDRYRQAYECSVYPNIWCSDDWTCNNKCPPSAPVSDCFKNVGITGLAGCLFGPESDTATVCYTPTGAGPACDCPDLIDTTTNNCLSGCPMKVSEISGETHCCNKGNNSCPPPP